MTIYQFTCPECGQAIETNGAIRDATLSNGCPVCGADVTTKAFTAE